MHIAFIGVKLYYTTNYLKKFVKLYKYNKVLNIWRKVNYEEISQKLWFLFKSSYNCYNISKQKNLDKFTRNITTG